MAEAADAVADDLARTIGQYEEALQEIECLLQIDPADTDARQVRCQGFQDWTLQMCGL